MDGIDEAGAAVVDPSKTVEFIATARKRFNRCVDATSQNRAFQLDDIKFAAGSPDNGWQWPEKIRNNRMNDPNGARPVLTINKLTQHIRLVVNEQRKNKPAGKIMPVDGEGDVEVAEVLQGIVRHIEVASHADIAYDTACESQVTIGEGYWRLTTEFCSEDSFDQDIRIVAIKSALSVYMDIDGLKKDSCGRQCQYGFITTRMTNDEYKLMFPDAKSKSDWDELAVGDDTFDWFDSDGVTIAEYYCVVNTKKTIIQWSDGSVSDEGMEPPIGVVEMRRRKVDSRKILWTKINGIEVLEKTEWVGKYIPIIRIVGNEWDVEGQVITSGIVRNAKDPQRMINFWTSQEAEILALAPKAPYIGATGQFEGHEADWRDANTKNFAYLEYNPVDANGTALPPPQRQAPPMPPAGFLQAKAGSNDDLQSAVGQYNPSIGAEAQEKSGRAIMARQQQADMGTFHYMDNETRGIAYSTEQILDLIPKVYDTERVARIIGEDGEPDHVTLSTGMGSPVTEQQDEMGAIQKIYDPSVGRYDVVVTVGANFSTKRMEAAEFLTAAAQSARDPVTSNVINYLAMKNQDWAGADEAATLMKKLIPPEIIKDEDEDPNSLDAQKQQMQQAAQMMGQKEAELNAHAEQLQQASQQMAQMEESARAQEQKAKDAMVRAQAKIDQLNAAQETFRSEQEVASLRVELQAKEMESKSASLDSAKKLVQSQVQTIEERIKAKLLEINSAAEVPEESSAEDDLRSAIADLSALVSAPRKTELIMDEVGNPVGSRSTLEMA
jgi:hypothetical protein